METWWPTWSGMCWTGALVSGACRTQQACRLEAAKLLRAEVVQDGVYRVGLQAATAAAIHDGTSMRERVSPGMAFQARVDFLEAFALP
jgi:hypothetical protein